MAWVAAAKSLVHVRAMWFSLERLPELSLALSQGRCRIERSGDDYDAWITAGGRNWQLAIAETAGWVTFRTAVTRLASRSDDELLSYVWNTPALRPARFAADRGFGFVCAEFPTSLGDGPFYAFVRQYWHALEEAVGVLVPDAPGLEHDPLLHALGPNTRHELESYPDSGWQPPLQFGCKTIDDVEITIDARVDDHVLISSRLPKPPSCDRALAKRILAWQFDRRSVGIAMNDEQEFFVAACWARKLLDDALFEVLVEQVVRAVPEAETLLLPA
jgi:hypothetical protein